MAQNKKYANAVQWCLYTIGAVFFAFLGISHAYAGMSIESISGSMQGGAEVVRIEFSEAPEGVPTGFSVQNPARIALDFPDTVNAMGRSRVDVNQGNLRSINVVQTAERSRVVINLKKFTPYRAEVQGRAVVLVLEPIGTGLENSGGPSEIFQSHTDASYVGDILPIKDIDFRRGSDGSGRVIVYLGGDQVGVDLQLQGEGVVLSLLDSSLPEGLRRRLDVSDFGTPVQLVTATQESDRVRLEVKLVGEWEHSAYQSDNQFVLEVRPKRVDLNKFMRGPNYTGEKLSLNFQNIEVRSLLQVIADFTDFNIVTSDTVTGTLTLRLKDVPWDQALQIIMDSRGLGMRRSGTVLWIAPKDEIDERTKKEYEALSTIKQLEPLRTQAYQLNYAKAEILLQSLTQRSGGAGEGGAGGDSGGRFLSARGSAIAEPRTNQLFVTDIPSKLEELQELLLLLDVPVRQVLIEARIVEARDTFGRALGVRLGGGDLRAARGGDGGYSIGGDHRVAIGSNYDAATNAGLIGTGGSGDFVNLPGVIKNAGGTGTFALSIFNPRANRFLSLELSALEADGQGKIISSPRVITADQMPASIEQGEEYPFVTPASIGGPASVDYKKAVLRLEVTPQITPEGDIILDLEINKDALGSMTLMGPAINTRKIKTQVLVENGGTVVIGGIFESEETSTQNKVPLLGDVPVIGNLFKSRSKESEKREMLVFITPKVVSDLASRR